MKTFIQEHPAQSLLVLALGLSGLFLAPAEAGIIPVGWSQLAAIGPSIAAIILVMITVGRSGLRRFLRRGLVWRVGLMGYSSKKANVMLFLSALEDILTSLGYKMNERGIIAAADVYRNESKISKQPG